MKEERGSEDLFIQEFPSNSNNSVRSGELSPLSYDEERIFRKLNPFKAGIMVVQSTVGISLFTLHEPLAEVGLLTGLLISIFTGYLTIYGATRLDWVASQYEANQTTKATRVKNAYELFSYMPGRLSLCLKWLTVLSNTVMMGVSTVSNTLILCILISSSYFFGAIF